MTNANAFHIVKLSNRWDRRGNAIDLQEETLGSPMTIRQAAKRCAMLNQPRQWATDTAIRYEIRDLDGASLQAWQVYRLIIGAEEFAIQEATPGFHINLDNFFLNMDISRETYTGPMWTPESARARKGGTFGT